MTDRAAGLNSRMSGAAAPAADAGRMVQLEAAVAELAATYDACERRAYFEWSSGASKSKTVHLDGREACGVQSGCRMIQEY